MSVWKGMWRGRMRLNQGRFSKVSMITGMTTGTGEEI